MRLEIIDDDNYKIFINNCYSEKIDVDNKEELGKYIKNIILKLKKMYNVTLQGLYEIHVYVVDLIGIILEINNMDNYFRKTIDLKIIVHSDEEIYLKVLRDELIEQYNDLKYFDKYFYLNVKELKEKDVYRLIENYNVVYGDELSIIKTKWTSLT
jgi:hypothetical protein